MNFEEGFTPKPTIYNNIIFRSRTEAKYARLFDILGIRYQYESFFFRMDLSNYKNYRYEWDSILEDYIYGNTHLDEFLKESDYLEYIPDFYLPDFDLFLEIKGKEPTEREELKAKVLSETETVILLFGSIPYFSELLVYDDLSNNSNFYKATKDRLNWVKNYDVDFGVHLMICDVCEEICLYTPTGILSKNKECNHKLNSDYKIHQAILDAYKYTIHFNYEDYIGEVGFPNIEVINV